MESIHARMAEGDSRAWAVLGAASRTAVPRLLAMLSILAVFIPSFFMTGVARQLFVPLSLAVGFAMLASWLLSSTFVPVLSIRFTGHAHSSRSRFSDGLQSLYTRYLQFTLRFRWPLAAAYLISTAVLLALLAPRAGTEIFPSVDTGQFQIRLRAPQGTRIERTERIALDALELIRETAGPENVVVTTSFVGVQPASYPINTIYLWTSGPHEAVLLAALKPEARLRGEAFREALRARFRERMPGVSVSFEAGDIVSRVMSFGADTPVEVAVQGVEKYPADPTGLAAVRQEEILVAPCFEAGIIDRRRMPLADISPRPVKMDNVVADRIVGRQVGSATEPPGFSLREVSKVSMDGGYHRTARM
jgi:multidrug efflux pump subunit AcrB